jgi:hypothetical protein
MLLMVDAAAVAIVWTIRKRLVYISLSCHLLVWAKTSKTVAMAMERKVSSGYLGLYFCFSRDIAIFNFCPVTKMTALTACI